MQIKAFQIFVSLRVNKRKESMIEEMLEAPQTENHTPTFGMGDKRKYLWSFLQRERVGSTLIFSRAHFEQLRHELNTSEAYIHQIFARMVKEGLISKKVHPGGGIAITFTQKNPKERASVRKATAPKGFSGSTTFGEALSLLDEEIKSIKVILEDKTKLRDQLKSLVGKEK